MQHLTLFKFVIFLFVVAFFRPLFTIGQNNSNKLLIIDNFCKKIDSDTSIKKFAISKDTIKQKELGCDELDCYSKNDTIFRLTEWSLHVTISSFDYYFQNGQLVFARLIKKYNNKITSEIEYYFGKRNFLKTKFIQGDNGKDDKTQGEYIKQIAEQDLTRLKDYAK